MASEPTGRVLAVEDDEILRELLANTLADEGYEWRLAVNAGSGLEILRTWRPDVILLDMTLPDMDGAAFRAEQLRIESAADVPVIILSGRLDARESAEALGTDILMKPFDLDDLVEKVAQYAGPGRGPDGS